MRCRDEKVPISLVASQNAATLLGSNPQQDDVERPRTRAICLAFSKSVADSAKAAGVQRSCSHGWPGLRTSEAKRRRADPQKPKLLASFTVSMRSLEL